MVYIVCISWNIKEIEEMYTRFLIICFQIA